MNHPDLAATIPTDKHLEIFRVLYPIFKDEIYKRREQMMRLTAFANTLLVIILFTLLPLSSWEPHLLASRWLAISGIGIYSCLFAYFIRQQAVRHRMAKQQLIELEKSLGLYQFGWHQNGESFFPQHWQTDWSTDPSVKIYLTILAAMTFLVICAMLIGT